MVTFSGNGEVFAIGWNQEGIMFFANGQLQTTFTPCCGHKMDELWTGWQKHCFTWNSGVSFKVQSYKPVCNGERVLDSLDSLYLG